MAGRGAVINTRRYWAWTDKEGKPQYGDKPPAGPSTPFGVGSTAPAAVEYEERTYEDGTKILSRFDPEAGNWVQESVEVDSGIRGQHKDQQAADAAGAKTDAKAPDRATFPDGSLRERNPQTGEWTILATKPQGPATPEAPQLHTFPDGSQRQWNPATSKWDVIATKPEAAGAGDVENVDIGAQRPGSRVDITSLKAQKDAFVASLNADKSLTREERQRRFNTYMQTVVQPQLDRAAQEANEEADRQRRRQEQQDAIAKRNADLVESREGRAVSAQDRQTKLAEDQFAFNKEKEQYDRSYTRGRDSVSDALALLKYRVDPSFSPSLAGIYNQIVPGAFSPGAFQVDLPDLDALANQHVGGLMAMHDQPAAPRAAAASVPGVAPPVPAPAPTVMPGMAAAAQTNQQLPPGGIQPGGVGGNPIDDEIRRRIAAGYGT